ncbi:MAG TPA: (d)CMP kinase [Cyclobacteriaceae bacterium]|nr:(d)CMP kinase [Cyclobacteriaceae bacterium]
MNLRKIIIAIDGYSACGKSTTARKVAAALGYRYIDTGAMYRAVTLHFLNHHVALSNPREVTKALAAASISFKVNAKNESEVYLNGLNVENDIREMHVSDKVSEVSAIREVRTMLIAQQRKMGKEKGVVMDGRDIGTVVFPDAELKIFMTADIMTRAYRRQQELLAANVLVNLDEVVENIKKRDAIDTTRAEGPLKQAADAIVIDTTHITIDEQVEEVLRLALSRVIRTTHSMDLTA